MEVLNHNMEIAWSKKLLGIHKSVIWSYGFGLICSGFNFFLISMKAIAAEPQNGQLFRLSSYLDIFIQLHDFLDSSKRQLLHTEILLEIRDGWSVRDTEHRTRKLCKFETKKHWIFVLIWLIMYVSGCFSGQRTTVRFLISSMTRGQKDCRVCWASLPPAPNASADILYSAAWRNDRGGGEERGKQQVNYLKKTQRHGVMIQTLKTGHWTPGHGVQCPSKPGPGAAQRSSRVS